MARAVATVAIVNEDRLLAAFARHAAQMDDIASRLARMERRLAALARAIDRNTVNDTITRETFMADFTALHAEVEANGDAVASAVTLLTDLSDRLIDAADDPVEIQAIAAELASQSTALAEAVVANTPAAPEPVEPEPAPEG